MQVLQPPHIFGLTVRQLTGGDSHEQSQILGPKELVGQVYKVSCDKRLLDPIGVPVGFR